MTNHQCPRVPRACLLVADSQTVSRPHLPVTLKRNIVVSVGVFFALLSCSLFLLYRAFRTTRLLHVRYEQVQRGMSIEEVQGLMAHSPSRASERWYPAWDDEQLPSAEAARIVSAVRYSVRSFFQPVSFEFTFDSDRRLVGRHIYD